jgi:conjugal transfer/type IV secretion protein DotA/TraY
MTIKNYLKKILAVAAVLVLPISAFAQNTTLGLPDFFTQTSPDDLSVHFLTQIFGHVPGVLFGMNFQLVAKLAEIFNAGLVSVMGALFAYTTLKVTLHAAGEGEMMAGKGKTLGMAVIRSVAGLSLAIPAGSGYSAVQIVVVWLAMQGIGFANMAWHGVVDYIYDGGVLYEYTVAKDGHSSDTQDAEQLIPIGHQFANLLQSEACVFKLQSMYTAQQTQQAQTNAELAASSSDITTTPTTTTSSASSVFGYGLNRDGVSYNFGTRNKSYDQSLANTGNEYNAECGSFNMDKLVKSGANGPEAAQSLIDYMAPAAKQLAAYDTAKPSTAIVDYLGGTISIATTNYTQLIAPARKNAGDASIQAARDALMYSKHEGWLTAGAYYLTMSKISKAGRQALEGFKPTSLAHGFQGGGFSYPSGAQASGSPVYDVNSMSTAEKKAVGDTLKMVLPPDAKGNPQEGFTTDVVYSYTSYLRAFINQSASYASHIDTATTQNANNGALSSARYSNSSTNWGAFNVKNTNALQTGVDRVSAASFTGGPVAGVQMTVLSYMMKDMAGKFRAAISPDALDPILKLQEFGVDLQAKAISYFLASFFVVFATVFASAWALSTQLATAMRASAELPSIITTLWIGFCFTIGGVLGYYLVLILFIVWFTAIISWFGHVFQAVFGAPLVALRMADPEGEGIIGKAGEGITMLFSLCLTPFLLVAGFVVALVVTKQALILFNYMFNIFMASTIDAWTVNAQTWLLVGMPMVIVIYTTIVVSMVQLISVMCLTEGMTSVKAFFAASAVGQRIGSEMAQETKSGAAQQASGQGQSTGGGVSSAHKALGNKEQKPKPSKNRAGVTDQQNPPTSPTT